MTLNHPEAPLLNSSLKNENDVMLLPWQNGTKVVTRELLNETKTSFYLRICRNDQGSAWCISTISALDPSIHLNEKGDTPIMVVARHCSEEFISQYNDIIKDLSQQPQSYLLTNDEGETALMIAAEEGKVELVRILLESGSDVNHLSIQNETVIDKAKKSTKVDSVVEILVQWILQKNVYSTEIEKELKNLFYEALAGGHDNLSAILQRFSKDYIDEMGRAILEGRDDVVLKLIDLGVDLQHKNAEGMTWKDLARRHKKGILLGVISLAEKERNL